MPATEEKNETQEMQPEEMMQHSAQTAKDRDSFIIGLIRNQRLTLDGALEEAKLKFADIALVDDNWQEKVDRKITCKTIEGQITILNKLERDYMAMFSIEAAA